MKLNGFQVYYIDPEEQINFLIQKTGNNKGGKVAFVIHPRSTLLTGGVNLQVLKGQAERDGVEVAFVTSHKESQAIIKNAGFSVFNNLDAMKKHSYKENQEDEKNREEKEKLAGIGIKARVLILFFLFVFAFTAYQWFLTRYPATTVEVRPVIKEVQKEIVLLGRPDIDVPLLDEGVLPLYSFDILERIEKEFPVRGTKNMGVEKARGRALIFNDRDEEVVVPEGTLLSTPESIKFTTMKRVNVPPRSVETFMDLPVAIKAGQVEVTVEALKAGTDGNVEAGAVCFFVPDLPLSVVNPEAMEGGKNSTVRAVSQEDINWAGAQMENHLKNQLFRSAYRELSGQYWIMEELLEIKDIEISFQQEVGEEALLISSKGSIKGQGLMIAHNLLDRLLTHKFLQDYPGTQIYSPRLEVYLRDVAAGEADEVLMKFEVRAALAAVLNPREIAGELAGLQVEEARTHLSQQEGIQSFTINASVDAIPRFPLAVRVDVQPPF